MNRYRDMEQDIETQPKKLESLKAIDGVKQIRKIDEREKSNL